MIPRSLALRLPLTGEQINELNRVLRDIQEDLFGIARSKTVTAQFDPANLPIRVAHGLKTPPRGFQVVMARPVKSDGASQAGNVVTFSVVGDQVVVSAVAGLTSGTTYDVTFLVMGG